MSMNVSGYRATIHAKCIKLSTPFPLTYIEISVNASQLRFRYAHTTLQNFSM